MNNPPNWFLNRVVKPAYSLHAARGRLELICAARMVDRLKNVNRIRALCEQIVN